MDGNEPAFPKTGHEFEQGQSGMSIRAYLAAKAMQGLCANAKLAEAFQAARKEVMIPAGMTGGEMDALERAALADAAVKFADALIAALNEKGGE